MLRLTLNLLFLFVFTLGCQPITQDTRADTRAAISGRIILVDENGLNDLSRVTVELGKGEGSTIPDEDGVFQLSDLEPDIYEVRIIYSGGLTADASESAYQEFNRRVLLQEGGAADIGDVVLNLGLGTVSGQLTLEEGADPTLATIKLTRIAESDKAVRHIGEETYSQNVDETGAFSVGDVQVGSYYVTVEGDGISATTGEGACLEVVQVLEHLELKEAPSFSLKSTAVRFSAGTDQIIGTDTSSRWMLSGDGVTIHVQASFAQGQKMWLQGQEAPAEYEDFEEAHVLDGLGEGETEVYFRFQDPCGYESDINTLTLVKDTEAPTIFAVRLHNDHPFALTSTVPLVIEATDANTAGMQMQIALCTLSAAPEDHLQPAQDLFVCDPALADVPWVPYSAYESITFEGGDGMSGVLVRVRDAAHNYEDVAVAKAIHVDTAGPTNMALTIGDGTGLTTALLVTLALSGEGADFMKVGESSGLAGVPWSAFASEMAFSLSPGDGIKNIWANFKDEAGNEFGEISATITLDSTPPQNIILLVNDGNPSTRQADLTTNLAISGGEASDQVVFSGDLQETGTYTWAEVPTTITLSTGEGLKEIHAMVSDSVGNTAPVVSTQVVLDLTPPQMLVVRLNNDAAYAQSNMVSLFVDAFDVLSASMQMQWGVCHESQSDCIPLDENNPAWVDWTPLGNVTLGEEQGAYSVALQVKDSTGNATEVFTQQVIYDSLAPQNPSLTIGDGTGLISSPFASITLSAEGASEMKIGKVSGLANINWQPYDTDLSISFSSGDGDKNLHAKFKDLAGNETEEISATAYLDTTGTLNGLIVVEEKADASAALVSLLGTTTTTTPAADGQYEITGVPAGVYTVQVTVPAESDKYVATQYGVAVEATQTSSLPNLYVELARGNLVGIIEVENSDDSTDYSGVAVEVLEAGQTAITTETGAFAMSGLIAGDYTVRVAKPGYTPKTFNSVNIVYQQDTTLSLMEEDKLMLIRGSLTGIVLREDGGDNSLIQIAAVGGPDTFADSAGNYTLTDLIPQSWELRFSMTGVESVQYSDHEIVISAIAGQTVTVPQSTLNLAKGSLAGDLSLEGVSDENDLAGVLVEVLDTGRFGFSNALGHFEIGGIVAGSYNVKISKSGYASHTFTGITIDDDQISTLPNYQLMLLKGGANGVVALEGGEDPSSVVISIQGGEGSAQANAEGVFSLTDISPGSYVLSFHNTDNRFNDEQQTVLILGGQTTELPTVTLSRIRGSLMGDLTLEGVSDENGLGGIVVELLDAGRSELTDAAGHVEISNVLAGTYNVQVSKSGYAPHTFTGIAIDSDQISTLPNYQLMLLKGGVIGTVVLEGDEDSSSVVVSIQGGGGSSQADNAGAFAISDLTPGVYVLNFHDTSNGFNDLQQSITILGGQTIALPTVTLTQARGSVSGVVTLEGENDHSGILIELTGGPAGAFVSSAPSGAFILENVIAGTYDVTIFHAGFVTTTVTGIQVSVGEEAVVPTQQLLVQRGSFSGEVFFADAPSVPPTAHIELIGTAFSTSAAADGTWQLTDVPPGTYNIELSADGYIAHRENSLLLNSGTDTFVGTFSLQPKVGSIEGVAVLEGQLSHENITITIDGTSFTTYTQLDGSWTINVPVGNYPGISASHSSGFENSQYVGTISVLENGEAILPVVTLAQLTSFIEGRVEVAGEPDDSGVTVTLSSDSEILNTLTTGADGNFVFTDLPLGEYSLELFFQTQWETRSMAVTVGVGPSEDVGEILLRERFLIINDNAPITTSADVVLQLGATDAVTMQISEDPTFSGVPQEAMTSPVDFTLSAGDGEKTIFIRFLDGGGSQLATTEDSIFLDSTSDILAFTHDAPGPVERDDAVNFAMDTGEPGGIATLNIANYQNGLALLDDGIAPDEFANDGVYSLVLPVETPVDVESAVVTGYFTDPNGLEATPATAAALTVRARAYISAVEVLTDTVAGTANILWETDEITTGVVHYGPDENHGQTLTSSAGLSHEVTLTGLSPSGVVSFQIYAIDVHTVPTTTIDINRNFMVAPLPPSDVLAMAGDGRVDIHWRKPAQAGVVGYFVYRQEGGEAIEKLNQDPLITDQFLFTDSTTSVDNTELGAPVNGTTYVYYVSSLDRFGNEGERSPASAATPMANTGPTDFCGVTEDTILSTIGSPYTLTCSFIVPVGVRLVMAPGTLVEVPGEDLIEVQGELLMTGGRGESPVAIQGTSSSSVWNGIVFKSDNGELHELENVELTGCGSCLTPFSNNHDLVVRNSDITGSYLPINLGNVYDSDQFNIIEIVGSRLNSLSSWYNASLVQIQAQRVLRMVGNTLALGFKLQSWANCRFMNNTISSASRQGLRLHSLSSSNSLSAHIFVLWNQFDNNGSADEEEGSDIHTQNWSMPFSAAVRYNHLTSDKSVYAFSSNQAEENDFRENYWGAATTAEMLEAGSLADISSIVDSFEMSSSPRVVYDNFIEEPIPFVGAPDHVLRATIAVNAVASNYTYEHLWRGLPFYSVASQEINVMIDSPTATNIKVFEAPDFNNALLNRAFDGTTEASATVTISNELGHRPIVVVLEDDSGGRAVELLHVILDDGTTCPGERWITDPGWDHCEPL